jgi:hypothetical protein
VLWVHILTSSILNLLWFTVRNMLISDERLREFIRAYEKEFDETLSIADARNMLHRLVMLYGVLRRPLPHEVSRPAPTTPPSDSSDHRPAP